MMTVHKKMGWKNPHADNIHIYVHYTCMKTKMICIHALDGGWGDLQDRRKRNKTLKS